MISASILAAICILASVLAIRVLHRRSSQSSSLPPLVAIPVSIFSTTDILINSNGSPQDEQLFGNPRHAYETALKQYGKIIGVPRKNRVSYATSVARVASIVAKRLYV